MKKILAIVPNGFEEIELLQTVDILRRTGFLVSMVSLSEEKELVGTHNINIIADHNNKYLTNDNLSAYDLLLIPGGKGYVNYFKEENCLLLKNIVNFFLQNNKKIAAICAAPFVLDNLNLIKNFNISVTPSLENKIQHNRIVKKRVVVDNNLITSSGPADTCFFTFKIIEALVGEEKATDYKNQLRYYYCTEENNFIES
ncbi:DJ-1/PfpI family protein [symbiont of Argiope bruennichi]|uniref:DJ-1 family glyoxalase III n=1 Tax=symbiont of Argiope bruennichi TaxID=2810479 RepID=UPI003DA4AADB